MKRRPYRTEPELRRFVLTRDGACLLSKIEPDHQCRDLWGRPHASTDLDRLTLEHVKDASMMGRRAPSDAAHLVALCAASNFGVPSKSQRDAFRAYLRAVTA
jgi:hypothetical protein